VGWYCRGKAARVAIFLTGKFGNLQLDGSLSQPVATYVDILIVYIVV
jgi:hypothetical protein